MKLKHPAIILYLLASALYLLFFRVQSEKELAILFKPMIVSSILYYYLVSRHSLKKPVLHYVILGIIFIADNVNLLLEKVFYHLALSLYMVVLFLFMYLILKDTKLISKGSTFEKLLKVIVSVGVLSFLILKLISVYVLTFKFSSYYFIIYYLVVFLVVFIFSFYNAIKLKLKSSKYLLITLSSIFFSDLFYVINTYYFNNKIILLLGCLIELPCYLFLLKYFMERDVENKLLNNNVAS